MIDIVPKFMVAVPDWPCIVKCAAAELVLTLLLLPAPVAPPQEVSPAPSTTMSTKAASPRITAEGRLPFRRYAKSVVRIIKNRVENAMLHGERFGHAFGER